MYARRSVAGIAAVFGREGGFVGQAVEYDAFAGEGESDHAHRHADVACRAVERHRGVVDDIAHGSVVDHAGQNAAVGAFRGFDRQRTGGVEDEIFDDGSGAQCAEESPCAVGSRVVAYHVEITDRVPLPVEEAREWTSRLDRQCVGTRQRTDRIADRCPRFDAGHVDVVEQYDEASFILPGGETFARIDCRGEFDEIVGRLDTARRREGVERFGEMSGREDTVLLVVGAYSRFVDVFCVGSAVGRREREFQTGLGDEAPYGELDCLGTGQIGVIGEMQRQFRSRSAGGRREGEGRRVDRTCEGQIAVEVLLRGGFHGERLRRTIQFAGIDAQFDDREDIAERDMECTLRKILIERCPDQRCAGRVGLLRALQGDCTLGFHRNGAFDGRDGIVGRQRFRGVVGRDPRIAGEGGRGTRFGSRVDIGRTVVDDRNAIADFPCAFSFDDVGSRCRSAGGFDDES